MTQRRFENVGSLEFLLEISYRPPVIIFIILGFLLVMFGWPNIYAGPNNSLHFGNVLVGLIGAVMTCVSLVIEWRTRQMEFDLESKGKHE